MIVDIDGAQEAAELGREEREMMGDLVEVHARNLSKNQEKVSYYVGDKTVESLGFALPNCVDKLKVTCGWGRKAVTSLAKRSRFDSYVSEDKETQARAQAIARLNFLPLRYSRAVPGELTTGCTFGKVTRTKDGPTIRFHSAVTAAAMRKGATETLSCGFCVMDSRRYNDDHEYRPSLVHFETPEATWVLERGDDGKWSAEAKPHPMGRPMMVAMCNDPDDFKPFGHSRLSKPVRDVIDQFIRSMTMLVYASEVYTSPQKALLGASDGTFELDKMQMYLTNMLLIGKDEDGDVPDMRVFSGSSMQPIIDTIQFYAKQFCNITDVPLNDMSIVTDNPSSAEAIYADKESLITDVEFLNMSNGQALSELMQMALAVEGNVSFGALGEAERSIMPNFRNPAMSSIASMADAYVKISGVDGGFAGTDVFYEGLGFDAATISRVKASKRETATDGALASALTSSMTGARSEPTMYQVASIVKSYRSGRVTKRDAVKLFAKLGVPEQDALDYIAEGE